jgi:hypothetical protein
VIDTQSEAGAWQRDWDSRHHTSTEYQQRIHELISELTEAYYQRDRYKIAMLNVVALVRGKVPNERYMPDQIYDILIRALAHD